MCSSFKTQSSKSTDAEQFIASGSTCDAYLVSIYGKLHFLKRLKPELAAQPRYVVAFHKEFETGFALNHPALPRYVSFLEDTKQPAIIEEYVEGKTLTQFLEQEPDYFHSRKHAHKFIAHLLSALSYLHSHQILFLDLKPDNILLTNIGHDLRLVDLGFCYTPSFKDTEGLTQQFAAPEQLQGKPVDVRTDIYLFGKIMEYCSMPPIYNKVVRRCMKEDPSERYSNMEEVEKAVRRAEQEPRFFAMVVLSVLALIAAIICFINPQENKTVLNTTTQKKDTIAIVRGAAIPKVFSNERSQQQSPSENEREKTSPSLSTKQIKKLKPQSSNLKDKEASSLKDDASSNLKPLTGDIHKQMDRIYASTLAQFKDEETIATKDFSAPFDEFISKSEALKKTLSAQYPDIPYATISTEVDRYTSRLLYPIYIKVTK